MLFNSYEFLLIFLPITIGGFYLLPKLGGGVRAGASWLSFVSLCFYGYWDIRYLPLLLRSIVWNYQSGHLIEKHHTIRRLYLIVGVTGNLLLLGYYKYAAFFIENLSAVAGFSYEIPHIVLPLGISFFTFTQIAYLVDAYRGETRGYSFLTYTLFVTIFPHLIAGPIINHKEMIPQFLRRKNLFINWQNFSLGLMLFIMGLVKKIAVADRFAPWANEAFSHTATLSMLEAWAGSLSYTLQLYFDFSAYSEMAIGLGLMLNLRFPVNFNSPYQSCSIIDFWRRWHMTLGGWVKNYLYIPMGGNRYGELKRMRNLLVSMLLIGFWHGAGWTFVIWGGIHGLALVINHQWRKLNLSMPVIFSWLLTLLTVHFAWVFFRAESVTAAGEVMASMLGFSSNHNIRWLPDGRHLLILLCIVLILRWCPNPYVWLQKHEIKWYWCLPAALALTYCILHFSKESPFLYFQF